MIDCDYAPLEPVHDLHIVRRQQYGGTVTVNFLEQPHDIPAMFRVQVPCWLICDQDLRLTHNRARDCHTLSFTTRELVWEFIFFASQADELDNLWYRRANFAICHASDFKREGDVFEHRALWEEFEVLEHDADLATQKWYLTVLQCVVVDTADDDLAARWLLFPGQDLQERRLARATCTDEDDKFFWFDVQTNPVERRFSVLAIDFCYPVQENHYLYQFSTSIVM